MIKVQHFIAASLLAMCLCTGCTANSIIRGQSPSIAGNPGVADSQYIQQTGGQHLPHGALKQELRGLVHQKMYGSQTSYHASPVSYPGEGYGASCQSGYCPQGNCQTGYVQGGYCPQGSCPPEYGQQCPGGCRRGCIHHYHTYSVKTMRNPVYPDPQQPGGVVTYPYYTHKGPDCFFYKGD